MKEEVARCVAEVAKNEERVSECVRNWMKEMRERVAILENKWRGELVYTGELGREIARLKERNREEGKRSEELMKKIIKLESQVSSETRKIIDLEFKVEILEEV